MGVFAAAILPAMLPSGDKMDMKKIKSIIISNERIPEEWFVQMTKQLPDTDKTYTLIVADRKDKLQDLFLFRRDDTVFSLTGHCKLPFHFQQSIAECLTSAVLQQIQIQHRLGNRDDISVLQYFSMLFKVTSETQQVFQVLSQDIISKQPISYQKIYQSMIKLAEMNVFDFTKYQTAFETSNQQNLFFSFHEQIMMLWNFWMQLISQFLNAQQCFVQDGESDIQLLLYGDARVFANFAEPSISCAQTIRFVPMSNQQLYQMTAEMLKCASNQNRRIYMTAMEFSFEEAIVHHYREYRKIKEKEKSTEQVEVAVFHDTMVCLPFQEGIYAGKISGTKLPFNGSLVHSIEEKDVMLVAPFSEAFATLYAAGKVVVDQLKWEPENDGWKITVEFIYDGVRFRPAPRIYSSDRMVTVPLFPPTVVYKKAGESPLFVYTTANTDLYADLYNGELSGNAVRLKETADAIYLKLYRADGSYLGQVDYRFV